jgi:hypothetical protein
VRFVFYSILIFLQYRSPGCKVSVNSSEVLSIDLTETLSDEDLEQRKVFFCLTAENAEDAEKILN